MILKIIIIINNKNMNNFAIVSISKQKVCTIVSWTYRKKWLVIHIFNYSINRCNANILSIIIKNGEFITQSSIKVKQCKKTHFRHTLNRICLMNILHVECFKCTMTTAAWCNVHLSSSGTLNNMNLNYIWICHTFSRYGKDKTNMKQLRIVGMDTSYLVYPAIA